MIYEKLLGENMNYFLESTVCVTIFYGLYYLIFRRLTFIRLNRIYLLSSLVIGLSLPLISYQVQEVLQISAKIDYEETSLIPSIMNSSTPLISNVPIEDSFDWNAILQGIYVLGISFMLIKFSIVIYKLLKIKRILNGNDFISTQSNYANSSFFNLIFIDDSNLSESEINQILEHEKWHIRLIHSYDLLFVEILKIIFWFNSILWLYQRSLSEIHEYEVDTRMIQVHNPQMYAQLLLKLAVGRHSASTPQLIVTHQFSRKPLTDRIHFLFTKQKSVPMKRLAYLSVLPILGAFFMAFSVDKVVDYQEVEESSKYFKIVRGEKMNIKSNDMSKLALMGLKKDEITLFIGFDRLSKESIEDARRYFKDYGFTLSIVNSKLSKNGKLVNIELSLLEDDIKNKQIGREKTYNMYNDGGRFDLEEYKKMSKEDKGFCLSISANKKTGHHSVALADIALTPPPPPVPPKPPKKMPPAPLVPPKPLLPLKPLPPIKVGMKKNQEWDKNKIANFAKSINKILGKDNKIAVEGQKLKDGLYMSNPITQKDWKIFLDYINEDKYYSSEYRKKMIPDNWSKIKSKSDKRLVTFVSFEQANEYCNWKSKLLNDKAKKNRYDVDYITMITSKVKDKKPTRFRLPTEKEWQIAVKRKLLKEEGNQIGFYTILEIPSI